VIALSLESLFIVNVSVTCSYLDELLDKLVYCHSCAQWMKVGHELAMRCVGLVVYVVQREQRCRAERIVSIGTSLLGDCEGIAWICG